MTRYAAQLNAGAPPLRAICLVVTSRRSRAGQFRRRACAADVDRRPDAGVLSKSIPLFFIGCNRNGLWVAREAEGRVGGVFLLRQSALHFAQRKSAPAGCATMFVAAPIDLDTENLGNPLVSWIDAALTRLSQFMSHRPAVPVSEASRKGNTQ